MKKKHKYLKKIAEKSKKKLIKKWERGYEGKCLRMMLYGYGKSEGMSQMQF